MDRKGLTLTEILVVTAIIAVITILAFPMLVKTMERAKVGEAISNLDFIRVAQKRYFLQNSTFSSDIASLHMEDPNDPLSRHFDYTASSVTDILTDDFTARAQRRANAPSPYDTYYYEISKEGEITSNGPLI